MTRGAIIRVDRAPFPLRAGEVLYVRKVSHARGGRRDFELTTVKAEARQFQLATAAQVMRELGPTACQFSVADAPCCRRTGALVSHV